MKVRKRIMRDLKKYEVEDFDRYAEWYIGKNMCPAAIRAILMFAKEHPESKDIRNCIFATMVRASTDIQNEFLSPAFKAAGVTNGHDCFCRFVRPIRANMFYIQIDSDEYVHSDKLSMDKNEIPEAYRIKQMIKGYGLALEKPEDLGFRDDYGNVLRHLSGLETEARTILGESEMRRVYVRDHPLGVHIQATIMGESWRTRLPVKVAFHMIPEKLSVLVKLIPRDEQQKIIENRDRMIDEFCDAYLRYHEV